MTKYIILLGYLVVPLFSLCQTVWSLDDCINYAMEHNLTIQSSKLKNEEQAVSLKMAKNEKIPAITGSLSPNMYFGRGPSRTGVYTDNNQASVNMGISVNMTLFSGGRLRREVKAGTLNLLASFEDTKSQMLNMKIQIIALYMQLLFDKEVRNIAQEQVDVSRQQLDKVKILATVDRATRIDIAERESMLANDKLQLSESLHNLALSRMELRQQLYLDDSCSFDVIAPLSDNVEQQFKLFPIFYYNNDRLINIPHIKAAQYRLESGQESILMAKSMLLPRISLVAGYANSYYYSYVDGYNNRAFADQLRNNGNEYIGLNINIPIFSGFNQRNQIKLAKINVKNLEIQRKEAIQSMKNEITEAYLNVQAALEKYTCSKESIKYATELFSSEETKYNLGESTFFDYNEAKKNLLSTQTEFLQAKYEYVFRIHLLNIYAEYVQE